MYSTGAVVAQEMFELVDCLRHVFVANAINNIEVLIGVGVIKPQPMDIIRVRGAVPGRRISCGRNGQGNQDENEVTQETVF